MKKVVDTMLVLAMLASYVPGLAEDIVQESLQESGKSRQTAASGEETDPPVQQEKPLPAATQPDRYDAVMNVTMDTALTGEMVTSTGTDENTIHVSAGTLTVSGAAITRASEDSADGELAYGYGVGAALLVTGGTAEISGSTITTDSPGGTGMFAYGDGTIRATDTVVDTNREAAGGVHAAAGPAGSNAMRRRHPILPVPRTAQTINRSAVREGNSIHHPFWRKTVRNTKMHRFYSQPWNPAY